MNQPTDEFPRYEDLAAENAALRDLLTAVADTLDLPRPAFDAVADYHRVLYGRSRDVRAAAVEATRDGRVQEATAWLRQVAAPITYTPHQPKPATVADADLGERLAAAAARVREQYAARPLPQPVHWMEHTPTSARDIAENPLILPMVSGMLADVADVRVWAQAWGVGVEPVPSDAYRTARTTVTVGGVTVGVEVWARVRDGGAA